MCIAQLIFFPITMHFPPCHFTSVLYTSDGYVSSFFASSIPPKLLPQFIILQSVKGLPKTTMNMAPASAGIFILSKCIGCFFPVFPFSDPSLLFSFTGINPFQGHCFTQAISSWNISIFLLPCPVSWNPVLAHLKQSRSFKFLLIFYLLWEAFLDHPTQKLQNF